MRGVGRGGVVWCGVRHARRHLLRLCLLTVHVFRARVVDPRVPALGSHRPPLGDKGGPSYVAYAPCASPSAPIFVPVPVDLCVVPSCAVLSLRVAWVCVCHEG